MEDLSLHIMDLVENSTRAGASRVVIEIDEEPERDLLRIVVEDNGAGMDADTAARVTDPFVTSRRSRRVGLGLSLLAANAQACGGRVTVRSQLGEGTRVEVEFGLSHIDRQPLGDWAGTLAAMVLASPGLDIVYRHRVGDDEFELSTAELADELGREALADAAVNRWLREQVALALRRLGSRA